MFLYQGKLQWYHYGVNETFVIVLPKGPVRLGDTVYLFSQWTVDAQGVKKRNWFNTLIVDSVSQTMGTDVIFHLKGSWYNFTITTSEGYKKLGVVMRNSNHGVSNSMPLHRIWEAKEAPTDTTRIWTGKFNWRDFAKNEPAIFIVPDGFGEGKPILSLWQYTKASNGRHNDPSIRSEVQKSVSGIGSDVVTFSYHSYYDINCKWEANTDNLSVHVKEGGYGEDVGSMVRSAIITHNKPHSHNFNPPEEAPTKRELECRLPQASSSLTQILTPMPFPKSLLETLSHTAAFVNQAGYLAKYAEDRFTALDADYHTIQNKLETQQKTIVNLETTRDQLATDRDVAISKVKRLEADLDKALKEDEKHHDEIHRLQQAMHDHVNKDKEASKLLKETMDKHQEAQKEINSLQKQLTSSKAEVDARTTQIIELSQKVISQQITISQLEITLNVHDKKNRALSNKNNELEAAIKKQKASEAALRHQLGETEASNVDLQCSVDKLEKRIRELIVEKSNIYSQLTEEQQKLADAETKLREAMAGRFSKVFHDIHPESLAGVKAH